MKVVALVSGGKDSCFSMERAHAHGHEIVALANLCPRGGAAVQELDSFCFQTVGHHAVRAIAAAMELPLVQRPFGGHAVIKQLHYAPGMTAAAEHDEVEDLYLLLKDVKRLYPEVEAVTSGAILSTYQRLRVENVCTRLKLTSLAYMWQRRQSDLLDDMIAHNLHAVLIKVAGHGLRPHPHLGKSLFEMRDHFLSLEERFGFQSCGEGGEYETFTLDCSVFKHRIVVDKSHVVVTDEQTSVGHLIIDKFHLEHKDAGTPSSSASAEVILSDSLPDAAPVITTVSSPLSPPSRPTPPPQGAQTNDTLRPASPVATALSSHIADRKHFCVSGCIGVSIKAHLGEQERPVGVDAYSPSPSSDDNLIEEARAMMATLLACVRAQGAESADVLFVNLYLIDMTQFQKINSMYLESFGYNPPSRACVQVSRLPGGARCMADCMVYVGSGSNVGDSRCAMPRDVLHVQSISEWAPTCIGPYSQANMLGGMHFQAGQIGLNPATMTLVRPNKTHAPVGAVACFESSALYAEALQSFKNCEAVLRCCRTEPARVASCVVFVNVSHAVPGAIDRLRELTAAWLRATERPDNIISFILVPNLPRGAAIEVLVTAVETHVAKAIGDDGHTCTTTIPVPLKACGEFSAVGMGIHVPECFCIGVVKVCFGSKTEVQEGKDGYRGKKHCDSHGDNEESGGEGDFRSAFRCALKACSQLVDQAGLLWSEVMHLQAYVRDGCFETSSLDESVALARDKSSGHPAFTLVSVCGFGESDDGAGSTVMQVYVRAHNIERQHQRVIEWMGDVVPQLSSRVDGDISDGGEEFIPVDDATLLRENTLAKLAVLGGDHRGSEDGDNVAASDCSDMSDVSDIFPSIAVGAGDEDSDEED